VGLYGYDGIWVVRTGGIRAGRRPCPRDVDSVAARCVIGVSYRLAVDNMRDMVDNPITPVHRRVEHATRGIATDRESDGEHPIWYTLGCARTGRLRLGLPWESSYQSHKNYSGKEPKTLPDPTLLLHGNSTHRHLAFESQFLSLRLNQSTLSS
jgi:hypothetical protein